MPRLADPDPGSIPEEVRKFLTSFRPTRWSRCCRTQRAP